MSPKSIPSFYRTSIKDKNNFDVTSASSDLSVPYTHKKNSRTI